MQYMQYFTMYRIQKVVANQTDKGYNFTNTVENFAYTKYQQVTYVQLHEIHEGEVLEEK